MILHNINPVFFTIGPISIRYYGMVYFFGFLFLYFLLRYLVKQNKIKNFDEEKLDIFMIYMVIGVIIGARLFEFIFYIPEVFFSDPLEFFRVWHGGMSYHGGLAGALIGGIFFTKKYKIKYYDLADIVILPPLFFLVIGRMANYINGEIWGTITNNAFCIDYSQSQYVINPPEGCRHPYQIYAAIKNFVVFAFAFYLSKLKLKPGLVLWWSLLMYNGLRFFVDFVREQKLILFGLGMGQLLSLFFSAISIYFIIKINKKHKKNTDKKTNEDKK